MGIKLFIAFINISFSARSVVISPDIPDTSHFHFLFLINLCYEFINFINFLKKQLAAFYIFSIICFLVYLYLLFITSSLLTLGLRF